MCCAFQLNFLNFVVSLTVSSSGVLKLTERRPPIMTSTPTSHTPGMHHPPIPIPAPVVDHNVYINAATGNKLQFNLCITATFC